MNDLVKLLGLFVAVRMTLTKRGPVLHVGAGLRKSIPLLKGKKNGTKQQA